MEITRPNDLPLTPEEAAELEKLKQIIIRAEADGKLSSQELAAIRQQVYRNKQASSLQFYRELELYRTLVTAKLEAGELEYDW